MLNMLTLFPGLSKLQNSGPKPINTFRDVVVESARSFMQPNMRGFADVLTPEMVDQFLVTLKSHGYIVVNSHFENCDIEGETITAVSGSTMVLPETPDGGET